MDSTAIIGLVSSVCTSGGILYLVVQKCFSRKQDNANTEKTIISNGNDIADLYNKIRTIVVAETSPIQEKLDKAIGEIDELKTTYCCYRDKCGIRLRSKMDVELESIKKMANDK